MSRANAQVKFPDGTIKHGIYNGTIDHFWFPLFDTSEQAWDAWHEYYESKPMDDDKWQHPYDDSYYTVEIADDYGGGAIYIGRASKSQIVSDVDTDKMVKIGDGLPKWWSPQEAEDEK